MPKTFKVNQKYFWESWFTGGTMFYTVSSRTENKVALSCVDYEADGIHKRTEVYDIETDENGNERILIVEYKGEKGYIYAE
jgi:hypothetical protein